MDFILIIRAIAGYLLLFFVPGYALTWTFFPYRDDLRDIDRLALSLVLSVASVMISVLFVDLYLGVDFTPENIVITVLFVTALACILWRIRRVDAGKMTRRIKSRILSVQDEIGKKMSKKAPK